MIARTSRAWLVAFASLSSGCFFVGSVETRVDTTATRHVRAAPSLVRDLSVKVLPSDVASTRVSVSSIGHCAEIDQHEVDDVVTASARVHPLWAMPLAAYGGYWASTYGKTENARTLAGVGVGSALLVLLFAGSLTSDEVQGHRHTETQTGTTPCDARPVPHVRMDADGDDGPLTAETDDNGIATLSAPLGKLRQLTVLGLSTPVRR